MLTEILCGPEGAELGHETVAALGRHELPVTPQNYEIWLNYAARPWPDLRFAINTLLENATPISSGEMEEIYERFFTTTRLSAQTLQTGSRLTHQLADALLALKATGATADEYGAVLHASARLLDGAPVAREATSGLVNALSVATGDMAKQNAALSAKLSRTADELDTLRKSLRQARSEALTDSLTGVANRKLFDETLRLRMEDADTHSTGLALIMADIDHFKKFNDDWGHQVGDQVIRFVASTLSRSVLPDHLVARYGGEEFAVIMPCTTLNQAWRAAEEMRHAIAAKRLVKRSTKASIGGVTVSLGVALRQPGEGAGSFLARADACLYDAKRNGRNQVAPAEALTLS